MGMGWRGRRIIRGDGIVPYLSVDRGRIRSPGPWSRCARQTADGLGSVVVSAGVPLAPTGTGPSAEARAKWRVDLALPSSGWPTPGRSSVTGLGPLGILKPGVRRGMEESGKNLFQWSRDKMDAIDNYITGNGVCGRESSDC